MRRISTLGSGVTSQVGSSSVKIAAMHAISLIVALALGTDGAWGRSWHTVVINIKM